MISFQLPKAVKIFFLTRTHCCYIYLAVLGLYCCTWTISRFGEQGLLSSCSAWASHCSGFSCCRAQALGCMTFSSCGSWALEHRFNSCDTLLPGPGIKPVSSALSGAYSLLLSHQGRPLLFFMFVFFLSTCHMGS